MNFDDHCFLNLWKKSQAREKIRKTFHRSTKMHTLYFLTKKEAVAEEMNSVKKNPRVLPGATGAMSWVCLRNCPHPICGRLKLSFGVHCLHKQRLGICFSNFRWQDILAIAATFSEDSAGTLHAVIGLGIINMMLHMCRMRLLWSYAGVFPDF